MPQPKLQKQRKAMAGYEKAIAGWWDSITNEKSIEKIAFAQEKIKKLERHIQLTEIAMKRLPGGNRRKIYDLHELVPEGPESWSK